MDNKSRFLIRHTIIQIDTIKVMFRPIATLYADCNYWLLYKPIASNMQHIIQSMTWQQCSEGSQTLRILDIFRVDICLWIELISFLICEIHNL